MYLPASANAVDDGGVGPNQSRGVFITMTPQS